MGEFTVTAKELRSKATELERLNKTLKQKIQALETEEASLNGMWEGEGKEAFSSSFKTDKNKMLMFHNEITKYVSVLRNLASKYEASDRAAASTARSN